MYIYIYICIYIYMYIYIYTRMYMPQNPIKLSSTIEGL